MRLGAILLLVGLAFGIGGCAKSCPTALLDGTLVAHGDTQLAIKETTGGFVREVSWPAGVGVRQGPERLVVTDFFGGVIAQEGDHVQLPGGERWSDGPWGVCGEITVEERGEVDLNGRLPTRVTLG